MRDDLNIFKNVIELCLIFRLITYVYILRSKHSSYFRGHALGSVEDLEGLRFSCMLS